MCRQEEEGVEIKSVFVVAESAGQVHPGACHRVRVCCLIAGEQRRLTGCQSHRREGGGMQTLPLRMRLLRSKPYVETDPARVTRRKSRQVGAF